MGKKEEAGQKGSYNTTEIKVQKEGRSVWVTNVHFLQYNSTKKMQFRDVLQEMHGKKFQGRSKENSNSLPQTEVNPNLCWIMTTGQPAICPSHVAVLQADDIYQNVKERYEMAN